MPCEEGMQKLIDSGIKFDLIITSPPYNIKDFHYRYQINFNPNMIIPFETATID